MLPGFSGGPLVDADGNVLGLNSSTLGRGGGFTIPIGALDAVVASLLTHGKVRRGFLGVAAQAARLPGVLAEELGRERGLLIVGLEEDGPAERDGLLVGDLIVALDGEPVAESDELQGRLSGDWVGKAIPIKVVRGGQFHEVAVTIGERPERSQPEGQGQPGWRRGPRRG
jgi:S1-C subfamily serine protease